MMKLKILPAIFLCACATALGAAVVGADTIPADAAACVDDALARTQPEPPYAAAATADTHWKLSETPAEVCVRPTGALAEPKPYMGTPNIVSSRSGKRVFAIFYGNGTPETTSSCESTDNYVMVCYGGESLADWSGKIDMAIRSPHVGKVRCFDPCGWRDPSGRVWIAWCQSTGEYNYDGRFFEKRNCQWSRRGSTWAIYTDNPDDANPVWSAPRRLFDGNMINKPLFLKDGGALYPVCQFSMDAFNDRLSMREGAGVWRTRDGGDTFEQIGNARVPDSKYAEHMLVEKNDGTIWMIARREPYVDYQHFSRKRNRYVETVTATDGICEAFSKDGGRTFGKMRFSKIPGIGSRTHLSRLKSGNLLLLKNGADDERWLAGKPKRKTKPIPRKTILAYLSRDDGKTWEGGLLLDDRRATTQPNDRKDVAYPDACESDNGFIYVIWDYSRYANPRIYAAKITEADILAGKVSDAGSVAHVCVAACDDGTPDAPISQN